MTKNKFAESTKFGNVYQQFRQMIYEKLTATLDSNVIKIVLIAARAMNGHKVVIHFVVAQI